MTGKAERWFKKLDKMVKDNENEKNICFISRGSWSDPQIAYGGYLLNYWDVEEIATPEDADDSYELTDSDWLCGCMDSLFAWNESGQMPDKFTGCDAMSVIRVIEIKS